MTEDRYYLQLNYCISASIPDINGNIVKLRHGLGEVEISYDDYNKYKEEYCGANVRICNKQIAVKIPRYKFRIETTKDDSI